jgi:hypothetical protein
MSRVRYKAKSMKNRYNSFKILTKLFETFCPLHERLRHFEKVKQLINILFYFFIDIRIPRIVPQKFKLVALDYRFAYCLELAQCPSE